MRPVARIGRNCDCRKAAFFGRFERNAGYFDGLAIPSRRYKSIFYGRRTQRRSLKSTVAVILRLGFLARALLLSYLAGKELLEETPKVFSEVIPAATAGTPFSE